MLTAQQIMNDYYREIQKAFQAGTLNMANLHYAPDAKIIGPGELFQGAEVIEAMLKTMLIPAISKQIIKKQYFDRDSFCTISECVAKKSGAVVPTVEYVVINQGMIQEFYVYFDTALWLKALS